jgi:hypothetical protein
VKPDVGVVDMDPAGFHKVKPLASVSACVVADAVVAAVVAAVDVADVVAEEIHLSVGAYLGFAGPAGSDQVVGAFLHSQRRQLEPFYLDPMAFVSSVEGQLRLAYLDQFERQLRAVGDVVAVAAVVAADVIGVRPENGRSRRLEQMLP